MFNYPIYCINVKENTVRFNNMQKRIQNIIRWDATTPNSSEFNNYIKKIIMSNTELACAISHYSLWKHLVNNNIEMALILEDDILFRDGWEDILLNGIKQFKNWDMFLLNSSEESYPFNQWVIAHNQWFAGAYLINKSSLEWLVNEYKNGLYAADCMTMSLQYKNNSYTLFPWLAIQEGKDSQIQNKEHLDADHAKVIKLLGLSDKVYNNYKN
jgi:GR25 family glycosyltransferase involved in LPS biosynthesis